MDSTRKALSFAIIFIFLDGVIANSDYENISPVDRRVERNLASCQLDADSVSIILYQNETKNTMNFNLDSDRIPVQTKRWTVFIIYGFITEGRKSGYRNLARSWNRFNNSNIFAVDWKRSACSNGIRIDQLVKHPTIVSAAQLVAEFIARFIAQLVRKFKVSSKMITLAGHGLGAHIAGLTGKMLQRMEIGLIPSIYGLDPVAPGFELNSRKYRLSYGDARFVQVFHTSNVVGMRRAIGDDDFYFNGGIRQPGCTCILDDRDPRLQEEGSSDLFRGPGDRCDAICNHNRAVTYLIEIFDNPTKCQFIGVLWNRSNVIPSTMQCKKYECSVVGPRAPIYTARGNFYVPVNHATPYCVGGHIP